MWSEGHERRAFSASWVWNLVRYKETDIDWSSIVWFTQCIPRHAFLMWLIMRVWHIVRPKVGMETVQSKWVEIVNWLLARSKSKLAADYVARVLVAASAYVIWQERNARIFKNQVRPPDIVSAQIIQLVRYKLMGVRLKNTGNVRILLREWEIHGKDTIDDGG
ncbi:uncharacterized protein LOC110919478 [Helianthus annuus]|uniref:uncharacterized protein LOC110919478 n=1 Tax=Helianthus annuus TaxID=4232 RepID=UPI000B8EEBB0|nr:uncharacterized protein LOC110919478 [Helianthus annuus]